MGITKKFVNMFKSGKAEEGGKKERGEKREGGSTDTFTNDAL